jgi:membrane associated rhomboid family serine protease
MYQQRPTISFGSGLTRAVKYLLIANVVIYFLELFIGDFLIAYFSIIPVLVYQGFQIWRVVSYMFLHSNLPHVFINMLILFFFGPPLERYLGYRRFYIYYFACGVGAGIACVPFYLLFGRWQIPIIGASGAIFGVLVGYGLLYPNSQILLWFVLPIKAKWLVVILGVFEFFATVSYSQNIDVPDERSNIASIAHLAGLAIGYFYLRRFHDIKRLIPWLRFRYLRYKQKQRFRVLRDRDDDDHRGGPTYH